MSTVYRTDLLINYLIDSVKGLVPVLNALNPVNVLAFDVKQKS